ncbi:mCG146296, partial [Mus musculus]
AALGPNTDGTVAYREICSQSQYFRLLPAETRGHEGSSFLLQILVDGKNDLGPLLCLLVSGVPEEPLQGLLVYVLKDVAHSFLASGCVEVVAVDGRAYSKRRGHAGGLMAWLGFHRCGSSTAQLGHFQGSLL